jgi:hypothetical protein
MFPRRHLVGRLADAAGRITVGWSRMLKRPQALASPHPGAMPPRDRQLRTSEDISPDQPAVEAAQ